MIHPDGFRFVGIFFAVTILLFVIYQPLGWIGFFLSGWCVYFFRNPKRVPPFDSKTVISPADGKVVLVEEVVPKPSWNMKEGKRVRISIFLNVFNVHVNRIPIQGRIQGVFYEPGQFFNASLDKASEQNERNTLVITQDDHDLACVQIAGLIARRIRCDVKEGDEVTPSQIYGIIRFGSRVDIYLPLGVEARVRIGQTMIAGETILANF